MVNIDPLLMGDAVSSFILIIAALINWRIFFLYYKGGVKPMSRYYFTMGLALFALLHEYIEIFSTISGFGVQVVITNQVIYTFYVFLKAAGPILIFYASLIMLKEAKKYLGHL